ncbi:glutathione S-transferase family protein [Bradyrhizobium sp. ARR65]|uniref:glutathione S-transferase family protein n=1 Tax=Bradyrhizobium sp. ARR65 TaxID=1040989 RepID=UPI0018DCCBCD|nr:glutathione S-transferase family protein [Bradyrhizobium sp. ARR65]
MARIGGPWNAQKSKDYLKINPNGRIPTLVDGDLVMFEAAAIVLHLVDRHPDGGLAPKIGTPERARFYQWMAFLTNSLQEELMIWQYPDRLTGADAAATKIVKNGAEKRAGAYLDVIEQHLKVNGPLFLGETLSAADFYLIMLARWARPMTKPPRSRPNVGRLLDIVSALPAVSPGLRARRRDRRNLLNAPTTRTLFRRFERTASWIRRV